ncbi:SusC/RagA family TonB-linked outer membrane protein [Ferruginibacter sp. SUN106]|uniref:SusC/RagA family TonB-linked outer membrane protein n=1 Tax=Ferruginibacter sp. SUN106 TaxID=2978348 RepID=UPI003D366DC0
MRKFANRLIVFLFFLIPLVSQAQTVVTGRVLKDDGSAAEGASVTIKGKGTGTKTDAQGNFTINAAKGDVLVISSVDFVTQQVTVKDATTITVKLRLTDKTLDEVVVTAMDIKRNPKELPYSVQKVSGSELQETQRENFVNSLQGRVAGLTVNQTGGAAGSSSQIVLRGFNSLSLDNTPLFVIDGVIADNSTLNETSNGGTSLGLASDRPNRGNDYSNRISDINPNDIESITVLKGPEATALYGSQASSGAIIITTKKAKPTGKLALSYDNSFRTQTLNRYPQNISAFAGGTNGIAQDVFAAFGPAYQVGTPKYDNLNNFFRNGFSQTHNLSASYGKKNASFIFSGSFFDQKSTIPTNTYTRYNLRVGNTTKIGKYIEIMPSISYINTVNDKPLRGASGYLLNLLVWPATDDIRDWQSASGLKKPLFSSNPNSDLDNPFYNVYKNRSSDKTNRWLATFGININPTKWLSIAGRFGYDTYENDGYTRYDSMSFYLTRAQKGQQDNYYRSYYGYNHTITATAKKSVGDFTGRIMVGNMWQDYEYQQWAVVGNNLTDANRTDSNNTDPATRVRLSNAIKGLPNYNIRRSMAYFGEVSIGWKSAVFLNYSHRFEESSIFPKQFRNYNYPAAGLSVIVTDLIPSLKNNILGYWKLRGSLASTARSSQPYANQSVFNQVLSSGLGYAYGFTNNNPLLQPEKQQTFEVGTELRFNNNRISLEATYYNTKNKNLIVEQFRASYGTGFVLNTLNVGANQNQGVEIAASLDLVKNKNFTWTSRLNFNKMWNKVLELPANVPEFYQSDTWLYANARGGLVVGGPTTTITAYGYARNDAGTLLISPTTGLPVLDNNFRVRGDRNPDFTLGFVNNMSYKRFRFSFLWDLKVGGDIFNATDRYLTTQGRSLRTLDRLNPRVIQGVLQDGLENTATPTKNTISITPYYNQAYYTTMPEEEFIEKDVNWLRLRDVSLSYSFPVKKIKLLSSLGAFVTINDLILITNYTGADPQVNGNTAGSRGVGAFGFDYGNVGTPVSVNFGIKAGF